MARAADLAELLSDQTADTLRAALLQLLPARHPAALGAAGSGKKALVSAAQVGVGRGQGVGQGEEARSRRAINQTMQPTNTNQLQAAAPPQRIIAAVRGLVGPLLRIAPAVQRLLLKMQRIFFLSEGQDLSS